jgi:UDP-N-acetylmuramyl pentapeptide phosphotransferase/UDP-N-acetylglucosamine-1-phosphate transferase
MRHGAGVTPNPLPFAPFLIALCASALVTAAACRALRPLLLRYALARPNARSSHKEPTPQGGGIALLIGMIAALGAALAFSLPAGPSEIAMMMGAAVALGIVGAVDDIRPLSPALRLGLQALGVGVVVSFLPPLDLPFLPPQLERPFAVLLGVWFVNLTNFMDGLDWLTVAGFAPFAGFVAVMGLSGVIPPEPALTGAALLGALLGFAPINRPVARLFLGDVGALSIGLIGAYLLYRVAGTAGVIPALILPLYHVTDATMTLLRRLLSGERVWVAHRTHAYQRATDNGFSVLSVSLHVAALNLLLCGLAFAALKSAKLATQLGCLGLGFGLTLLLIGRFSRNRT